MPLSQANNRLYTRSSQLVGQNASGLDIDGLSDIGEAIADADLFIIDNGGGGTNTKTAVTRIPTYVFSGISGAITINSSGVASFGTNAEGTNLTLSGNLTVNGTTTNVSSTTVTIDDPLFALADNNSADSVDIGWYGKYVDSGTKYSGLFRDASDSDMWKLFATTGNSNAAPSTTVDTTSGFALANLSVNELTGTIATAAQTNITSLGTLTGLTLDGDKSVTPGDGAMLHLDTSTITDSNTSGSGTAALYSHVRLEAPTLAATNSSVTTTAAATLYISAAPAAGSNQTLTNAYALYVDAGNVRFDGDIIMSSNTAGNLLIADGSTFSSTAVGDLSEISTVANDDVFIAIDTSGGGLKKITRSAVVAGLATSSAISNVSEDTTPQLGGDLDVNSNDLVSTSNGNISLLPNGSGKVVMDGNGSSGGISISDGTIDIRTGTGSVAKVLFYCEVSNAHAQTIQAQPHSAGVTNTLTLPAGGNGELVSTVATQTLTNKSLGSDLDIFDDANNADVKLTMGTSATESLTIQVLNGSSNKTAEEVHFSTATASSTANHGKMVFDVDGSDIVTIDDDGLAATITTASQPNITTLAGLTTIGAVANALAMTFSDVTLFHDANNADTSFSIGTSATEALKIEVLNGSSNKTAEEVHFSTATASGTGDHGKMVFDVDGTDIAEIDDSGINIASGKTFRINGSAIAGTDTTYTAGDLLDLDGTEFDVDLTEAGEAAIANGDYILFLDGGATGTHAKEAIADVATLFAGTGLTATNSVIAVDSSQAITALTGGDLTIYEDANNADVSLKLGTSATEALSIEVLNGGSNKTAEEVHFSTATASSTADHGKMVFDIDGTDILTIDDGGLVIKTTGTIGPVGDEDLVTLTASGSIVTVAGELSVTTLDIGGTNVTSTAAELNILDDATVTTAELNLLDGDTSVGGSITLADADGVVVNDGGTMKTIPASDVKTYASGDSATKGFATAMAIAL